MTYAAKTEVSVSRSRDHIGRILQRYGAEGFGFAMEPGRAMIGFQTKDRRIRFILPIPRGADMSIKEFEQSERSKWRALLLSITAKLEAVESGIESFDSAFMSHIVMPNGQTMAEHALPYIKEAYSSGKMPPLLSFGGGA
jgi:hypothetical protein